MSISEMENPGTIMGKSKVLSGDAYYRRVIWLKLRRAAGTGFTDLGEDCLRRVDKVKRKAGPGLNSNHLEIG